MKRFLIVLFLLLSLSALTVSAQQKNITPETALRAYLNNGDASFTWKVKDQLKGDGLTFYQIQFVSQTWQTIKWSHELMIMVPDELKYKTALLFITGGSNKNGAPNTHKFTDDLPAELGRIAKTNHTITSILWQVPNQPLYEDLTEDALISKTLHNYLADHDFSWPLLFPMTKSAIRGMDIVQEFAKKEIRKKVTGFVISGASKRGWTTWLTGANDKRVVAIGPMVIDVLNMPVNVDYQRVVWGDYSIEIEDYVKLGIAQQLGTPGGNDLTKMIDPYSYRKNLTMPKMIFMGTNDPYWPVDAVKNYIDSIPGNNHICYTPNAGHDLGDKQKAFSTLSAFLGNTASKNPYPICDYSITQNGNKAIITVKTTPEKLIDAFVWTSTSTDQDFRDEKWNSVTLNAAKKPEITVEVDLPQSGFKAFYVDLKYQSTFGKDFTQSTRMFVLNNQKILLKEK